MMPEPIGCDPFRLFRDRWALVTAGTPDRFNTCTVSWGSMGTLWTRSSDTGSVITVYIHPGRYTNEFLMREERFTVSFFSQEHRNALSLLGSRSGRDGDKVAASGLTPVALGGSVTFREAEMTFLCRKLYGAPLDRAGAADEICAYYEAHPETYPPDADGTWRPHCMYIGEILERIGDLR